MSDFLIAIRDLVTGLIALEWPGIGLPWVVVVLGLWLFYAVGKFVVSLFYGDYPSNDD